DPTAFFENANDNLLWDYELPSYSTKNSSKSGFYLMAKKSSNLIASVRNSLKNIPDLGDPPNNIIHDLLGEISERGIPTLKTLASGGASANGEIGMLVAMKILQNIEKEGSFELFPFKSGEVYNLLIPVDPFKNQLEALYQGLN